MNKRQAVTAIVLVVALAVVWPSPGLAGGKAVVPALAVMLPGVLNPQSNGQAATIPIRMRYFAGSNLTFGRIDPSTHAIVDGDYIVWFRIDLGDAPVSVLQFGYYDPYGVHHLATLTPQEPVYEALMTFNIPGGIPPDGGIMEEEVPGLTVTALNGAPAGSRGQFSFEIALLNNDTYKHDRQKAPGISADVDVIVTSFAPVPGTFVSQWHLLEKARFKEK